MRRTISIAVLAACAPVTLAQTPPPRDAAAIIRVVSPVVALTNVNVIDGTGAPARPNQTVLIESGHIRDVGDASKVVVPDGAKVFDLAGQSVLPGLVSLHDHIMNQSASAPELYLAGGVTTLRTAGGSEPYGDLNLRQRIESGRIAGPELFVTGPFLSHGERLGFIFMKNVRDAAAARAAVRYWAAEGVTSIKVYREMTPPLLRATVEAAHELRLPVLGHLEATTCAEAAKLGLDSIEHGFATCQADLRDATGKVVSDPESPQAQALIKTLVGHNVSLTPTPVDLTPHSAEALEVMHAGMQAEYAKRKAAGTLGPGRVPVDDEAQGPKGLEVAFVRAGGRIALGADCAPTNPARIPGFANHKAVRMLFTDRGFTALEAIRIATLNGAAILKIDDRTGSIAKGKEADLMIVKGDPSTRIADIDKVTLIFSNGVAYDPKILRSLVRGLYGLPSSR